MKNFWSSRTRASMLLAAFIFSSLFFISTANLGGINTDNGRFSIVTRYYGVTAEEIERTITIPMEEAVSGIPGITRLRASSEFSLSRIDLKLSGMTDTDEFIINIRDRVDRTYSYIANINPAVQKPLIVGAGSDQQSIFSVAFSDASLTPDALRPIIESEIKPSYARIQGLGEIEIYGGGLPEIHVAVDPDKAAASGYNSRDIASIIQNSNIFSGAGNLDNGLIMTPVSIDARINSLEIMKMLPVEKGIRISDIASVLYSSRSPDSISRLNSTEHVSLSIKSSSPDLITISKLLRAETLKWRSLGYHAEVIFDKGAELEKSFNRITVALAAGIFLSSLILLLFNVNTKRVFTLLLTQPVIIMLSLGILAAAGFSPDHFLLAGIALGTGMILDSALIITDSIDSPAKTPKAVIKPLISSTLSTLIALIPVIPLRTEIPGLSPLITALSVMLGTSLVFSILFIPSFYKGRNTYRRSRTALSLLRLRKKSISRIELIGRACIRFRKRKFPAVLLLSLLLTTTGCLILFSLPISLNQPAESSTVFGRIELAEGESIESADIKIKEYTGQIEQLPFIVSVQSVSRRGGGDITVKFNSKTTDREHVIRKLKIVGQTIRGGFFYIPEGYSSDMIRLNITVTGPELTKLKELSRTALNRLLQTDWAVEGILHFKEAPPALHFIPDQKAAAERGFSALELASFLRWNLQGPVADKWLFSDRERDLRVMALKSEKLDLVSLEKLKIPHKNEDSFSRLDQLGSFIETTDSSRINRLNRQHSESFTVGCRRSDPVELNEQIWKQLDNVELPPGYSFIPSASLIERQKLFDKMWMQFGIAILLIFFLLCIERESLTQALLIILQIPFILSMPLIVIKIAGIGLGTETIIGFILISGMGINNGILIIDNIELGLLQALKMRFNGIFLTTVTSICGIVPLLLSNDPFFIKLAVVLVSGLASSFLVSVLIFPQLFRFSPSAKS